MPDPPRRPSLTRQTLIQVALRFAVVGTVATVLSYYHVLHGLRTQALEQLEKYALLRGEAEGARFRLAGDNLRAFAAAYASALESRGERDPRETFDGLFAPAADGTLRLRESVYRTQRITGLVGKYVEIDGDLRRRLVLGVDLLGRYGPAWENRFVNLYLTTPENAVLMYWPGRPWGLNASSWEVQAKLPAPAGDPVRVLGGERPAASGAIWSEPYFDYAVNDWMVSVAQPVALGGRHLVTVAHDILLHELIERTVTDALPGTYNLVFSEDGLLIAHPRLMDAIRAQGGRFAIAHSGDRELGRIFSLVRAGHGERPIVADPEGAAYLAAARLAGPRWYLATVFPQAIVAGRAFATARLVLLLGALALVLELLVLWYVLRHRIARPLAGLIGATERVASGDYRAVLDGGPDNELGRLARSFNLMSEQIRRTLERLKETTVSRGYLDSIIANTGEGIVTLDERGFIASMNRAAESTFGCAPGEALGIHAALLLAPSATDALADRQDYADPRDGPFAETGSGHPVELAARRWDGTPFPMELVVTGTELDGRRVRICILRDVGARKQADEALRQAKLAAESANRAKSEFLATMSHELRTPLNSVLGYAQILLGQEGLSDRQRHCLAIVRQSGEHLLGLIEDVLDLAKVEAGTLVLNPAPCALHRLVGEVGEGLLARARQKGLELRVERSPDLPDRVLADERRLRQILTNLLDNAVKYTERGTVTLSAGLQGDRVRLAVEDTGPGIAQCHLGAIFESFRQVRGPGTYQEGAGLGLAICKRLAGLMGGTLGVASQPGAGSRFWLDLTLSELVRGCAPSRPESQAEPEPGPAGALRGAGRRVLIADDREDNRRLLRDMLAPQGFALREAADGGACIREALAWRPDLILVDLKMPVLDGEAAIRRVRATPALDGVKIVAVSASVFGQHRDRCLGAGADAFLPKPIRMDALLDLLHRLLGVERIGGGPDPDPAPVPGPDPGEGPPPPLPEDRWQILAELARRGDIAELRAQARQLAQADRRHGPFAAAICSLADGFQIRRIRELLLRVPRQMHTEGGAPPVAGRGDRGPGPARRSGQE